MFMPDGEICPQIKRLCQVAKMSPSQTFMSDG